MNQVVTYDPVKERTTPLRPLKVNYSVQVTEKNIEQIRKLNVACFPVRYGDGYYRDILRRDQKFTILGPSTIWTWRVLCHFLRGSFSQHIMPTVWSVRFAVAWRVPVCTL